MPQAATTDRRPRVLLVEDDVAVGRVVATVLERAGFQVVVALSGADALTLLDNRFDALVCDLRLPGMRGDAVYYAVSARQPWLARQSMFLTGDIDEAAERIIADTGRPAMLKPFSVPQLVAAVRALIPPASALPAVG